MTPHLPCSLALVLAISCLGGCSLGDAIAGVARYPVSDAGNGSGPRVLCVVAHPDDEIAFAGVLYKTATHLGGSCDVLVVTNGEAGYKYATLGERIYRLPLTDPAVGRAHLPDIRRRELIAGCRVLGVNEVLMLGQRDHRFTLDPAEVLAGEDAVWDVAGVTASLAAVLEIGDYDFVLTHLPVPATHGHHKAATILALQAIAAMPAERRPVALGARPTGRDDDEPAAFTELPGYPLTRVREGVAPFRFDRAQKFGFKDRLSYQIVANWAIAEHRSQGTMQLMMGRWEVEDYLLYDLDTAGAEARAGEWFAALAEPQFAPGDYDEVGNRR